MSTRVTSAIASRKARENLVRLLFPQDEAAVAGRSGAGGASSISFTQGTHTETDRHSHSRRRRIRRDASSSDSATSGQRRRHSYSQLRSVYLERVHAMHPDKVDAASKEGAHLQFIELKSAWEEYHSSVRIVRRRNDKESSGAGENSGRQHSEDDIWEEDEEDCFTMFGVGCSFADSPEERDLRNQIMEQACRGWFSSGSISDAQRRVPDGGDDGESPSNVRDTDEDAAHRQAKEKVGEPRIIRLSDDDMFVQNDDDRPAEAEDEAAKRKFLVPNADRIGRRRR